MEKKHQGNGNDETVDTSPYQCGKMFINQKQQNKKEAGLRFHAQQSQSDGFKPALFSVPSIIEKEKTCQRYKPQISDINISSNIQGQIKESNHYGCQQPFDMEL